MDVGLRLVSDHRTVAEFEEAFLELPPPERRRLLRIARALGAGTELQPDDLLQEALLAVIEKRRPWPAEETLVAFLSGVMRSLVHGQRTKRARSAVRSAVSLFDDTGGLAHDIGDEHPTPEEAAVLAAETRRITADLEALFAGDEAAEMILLGMREGTAGEELRALTGLDRTAFDSKRRFVRRRIDAYLAKEGTDGKR